MGRQMNYLVFLAVGCIRKSLVTNTAFIWHLPCVNSFMVLQISFLVKAFSTVGTPEWFFTRVD
jgi:hypothetical protein